MFEDIETADDDYTPDDSLGNNIENKVLDEVNNVESDTDFDSSEEPQSDKESRITETQSQEDGTQSDSEESKAPSEIDKPPARNQSPTKNISRSKTTKR